MRRAIMILVVVGLLVGTTAVGTGLAADADSSLALTALAQADLNTSSAVQFKLPGNVAAVDGRLYFDADAAEFVGLAPVGKGEAFRPVDIPGGVAFGAYGLKSSGGQTTMRIVVAPLVAGHVEMRLVIDSAADKAGRRVAIMNTRATGTLSVAGGSELISAPVAGSRLVAPRAGGPTRSLFGDGQISVKDLDIVLAGWEQARLSGSACDGALEGDANGDGCVDIVDVQAVVADQGRLVNVVPNPVTPVTASAGRPFAMRAGTALEPIDVVAAASAGPNFVVDTTADTADAAPGNGICADAVNNCSLRAAITESNWWPGNNRIEFNLVGTAPVRIQLTAGMPLLLIQDAGGDHRRLHPAWLASQHGPVRLERDHGRRDQGQRQLAAGNRHANSKRRTTPSGVCYSTTTTGRSHSAVPTPRTT